MKHILSISELGSEDLFDCIIPAAEEMITKAKEASPEKKKKEKVQLLFFEPSTRTFNSYKEAISLLSLRGASEKDASSTSLIKKESYGNTARMFAEYNASVIVMRTKVEGAQRFIAEILEEEGYNCAVHNAGDGANQHPTQTVLDLLTIKSQLGRLDDFTIGFFGDLKYGRTVHSLLTALAKRENIKLVLVEKPETSLQDYYKELFTQVENCESMEGLDCCDVIYGARIQEERFEVDPIYLDQLRRFFTLDKKIFSLLKERAIVLHPMPYVQEFPPDVRREKRLIIDHQAWCGIPSRMALLKMSIEDRFKKGINTIYDEPKIEIIKTVPVEEYFRNRAKKKYKEDRYFSPIKNGTIIDHLPEKLGGKVKKYIRERGQKKNLGAIITVEEITDSQRLGGKDIVILENNFLDEGTKAAIISLFPTVTINVIKDGIFKKERPVASSKIRGFGKCPNEWCITNKDPEAEATFSYRGNLLKCHYCERVFSQEQVII